jgi:glutamine phosphoribosylpyrophosphate amidotransferase
MRKLGIKMKFNTLPANIKGKKVVIIDDSIVRGNTIHALVKLFRFISCVQKIIFAEMQVLQKFMFGFLHLRFNTPVLWVLTCQRMSSSQVCFACCAIQIDPAYKKTVSQIQQEIQADSLAYLSHEGMMKAVTLSLDKSKSIGIYFCHIFDSKTVGHCSACFTGKYPLQIDW